MATAMISSSARTFVRWTAAAALRSSPSSWLCHSVLTGLHHGVYPSSRRKKEAREAHSRSKFAQKVHGLRAKLYNQKRFKEKVEMKKTYAWTRVRRACVRCLLLHTAHRLAMHDERKNKHSNKDEVPKGAVPAYLLDREGVSRAKVGILHTCVQWAMRACSRW